MHTSLGMHTIDTEKFIVNKGYIYSGMSYQFHIPYLNENCFQFLPDTYDVFPFVLTRYASIKFQNINILISIIKGLFQSGTTACLLFVCLFVACLFVCLWRVYLLCYVGMPFSFIFSRFPCILEMPKITRISSILCSL